MTDKTVIWTLVLLILNFLICVPSLATENGAKANFEINETQNENKMSMKKKNWNEPETENWKPLLKETSFQNLSFPDNVKKCIRNHQYEITLNFKKGKTIILKCVKEAMITNLQQYLTVPSNFSITFFNGLFEFTKIPDPLCSSVENSENLNNCKLDNINSIDSLNKTTSMIDNKKYFSGGSNNEKSDEGVLKNRISDEEQIRRIENQKNTFLSELLRGFGNYYWEKKEMDEVKNEINDFKLLNTISALTRNYVFKIKYYPEATAIIKRGANDKIIFDVEIEEHSESVKEDEEFENELEENWREGRLEFSSESEESQGSQQQEQQQPNKKKKKKKDKKDKKESRKQQKQNKKIKKHFSYLIIPFMIQLALLPFVLKKLFFLAMGALTGAKIAILLVVYRLLRNFKVQDENYYLRLEHYGYKEGQEYGSWVNGRRFRRSLVDILSEAPFMGRSKVKTP